MQSAMKDLINLKENHYVVQHLDKPYAVNGIKHPIENLKGEKVVDLHPISKVGIINYNEIVKVKSSPLKISSHSIAAS